MECSSCVDSVKSALLKVDGVEQFDIDLGKQRVSVSGVAAPSLIVKAIENTGRDAIIRGTGEPNSAAVAILESFDTKDAGSPVKGLARIVAVGSSQLLVDLTVNGLPKGKYFPSIMSSGNISRGALSTGDYYHKLLPIDVETPAEKSLFSGQSFQRLPLTINELIGRSFIISGKADAATPDSIVGVIARSAGVWENDKHVCSCSGKTVWEERKDAKDHGITA